ncbi:MAG TPA: hypothetical protein VK599_18170, partial [Streptosporangiaceae bacterium]|nr:hypothetical protein [Streptosporangiaceae bacterium]
MFLRAGRAGLAPEAVTVVGDPGEDALASPPPSARPDVAGLPPWADELPAARPDTLPPWEAGPWPGANPPSRDPAGDDDHGQPVVSAGRAGRPADPFAGHFADTGEFADIGPFTDPASRPPAGDSAAAAPAGSGPADSGTAGSGPAGRGRAAGPSLDPSRPAAPAMDPSLAGRVLNGFTAADTALDPFPALDAAPSPGGPATGPAPAADGHSGHPGWPRPGAPAISPAPARSATPGAAVRSPGPAGSVLADPVLAGPGAAGPVPAGPGAANPLAKAALAAGILGVAVLPGVVLGILGLRRAAVTGTGRLQSWLGIALSLLWAAGIVILALPGPGPASDPGCVQYRAGGTAAVARVTSALKPEASSRLRAGLGPAAGAVNDATASAQNIQVRNTLAALSGDLQAEQAA